MTAMRIPKNLTGAAAALALALSAGPGRAEAPAPDVLPAPAPPSIEAPSTEAPSAAPPSAEAPSASPAETLEQLLDRLAKADAEDPAQLQRRIGEFWSTSGSDSMDLLLARGREAMDDEAYDKAIDHLSALTRLAPDFAEGFNARATAHFLRDDYWASVRDIQRALALEPRHFGALAGLGVILERLGDESDSLAAHRAALAVNPHLEDSKEAVERLAPLVDGRDL
jgi:tetratricopeptide (TPR) repeat protein